MPLKIKLPNDDSRITHCTPGMEINPENFMITAMHYFLEYLRVYSRGVRPGLSNIEMHLRFWLVEAEKLKFKISSQFADEVATAEAASGAEAPDPADEAAPVEQNLKILQLKMVI